MKIHILTLHAIQSVQKMPPAYKSAIEHKTKISITLQLPCTYLIQSINILRTRSQVEPCVGTDEKDWCLLNLTQSTKFEGVILFVYSVH